jgi:hypothetical protein
MRFFFGSVQRSQPVVSRRSVASSTPLPGTTLYTAAAQPSANIQRGEAVIVRPPVYASVDRTASIDSNAAARSRLILPVLPQGAPQVPAAASTESISPAPTEVNIAPANEKPLQVQKAVPVWPEAPDHPDYGRPIHGRPGFVHPPGITTDAAAVVDVRGFAPGDKVRDPRNGNVFLVPPY